LIQTSLLSDHRFVRNLVIVILSSSDKYSNVAILVPESGIVFLQINYF